MENKNNNKGVIALLVVIIVILAVLCVLFATGTISLNTSTTNNNEQEIVTLLQPKADSSKDGYWGRQRRAYEPRERQTSNESIQNEVEKKKREKDVGITILGASLKVNVLFIRCFYCGKKGHIKKRCLQLE